MNINFSNYVDTGITFITRSRVQPSRLLCATVLAAVMFASAGCHDPNAVQVQLSSRESTGKNLLELKIEAQVTGPQAGLHYKWLSTSGECDPQMSDAPATTFTFAENSDHDRVSLEVWRDEKCVARGTLDVALDSSRLRIATEQVDGIKVQITNIPPYSFKGGSLTHAAIGGMVSGKFDPGYKIVIYAQVSDIWFIQPETDSSATVATDGSWTNWTHTGCNYAALLVHPGYYPERRRDMLPPIGGYVAARSIVEGVKK
jgi:hypothetical protein